VTLFAFETSCDETSAALIRDGAVLSTVVASQIQTHAEYGGVVPELAAREHLRNVPLVAREVLSRAGVKPEELDAVAATRGPGLPSALMAGLKAAQALAFARQLPFIPVHHHEAHLYSPWIGGSPLRAEFEDFQPNVSLIVSGGHTLLVQVMGEGRHRILGSTIDDAAGECFDKSGKLMGLPYPAGPCIDQLADKGDAKRHAFPRPLLNDPGFDFSFSGLKTSVRYFLRDHPESTTGSGLEDVCAGVQAAIVEVLVVKTLRAAKQLGVRCVTASGGVSCNRGLRAELAAACKKRGLTLRLARPELCTDNAAMIGILAERKLLQGRASADLDEDILPNWPLAATAS
jgi:N6-L-threonylcarbamoyladenine synthase